MIVTKMQYLEPVYRGKRRGTNYEFVHVEAYEISQDERKHLEGIAKNSTYTFGVLGSHKI